MPSILDYKSKGLVNDYLLVFSKAYKETLKTIPDDEDRKAFYRKTFEFLKAEINSLESSYKYL